MNCVSYSLAFFVSFCKKGLYIFTHYKVKLNTKPLHFSFAFLVQVNCVSYSLAFSFLFCKKGLSFGIEIWNSVLLLTNYQFRYINKLSNVKGITWGLDNKDAESPEGWRDDLLEFSKYGGPGRSYEGKGKLPPRLKDIIVHYFWLLGLNPNEYCKEVPEDYVPRDLDNLDFLPPPESFEMPAWATPPEYEDEESEDEVVTRKKR